MAKETAKSKSKPKQDRLPEMADAEIQELEDAATEYAQTRDERQALLKSEVDIKDSLLALMKKHDKDHYEHNDIEISRVFEKEKVKVRIKKNKKEDEEAA